MASQSTGGIGGFEEHNEDCSIRTIRLTLPETSRILKTDRSARSLKITDVFLMQQRAFAPETMARDVNTLCFLFV
jgi:hypothetical protein